MARSPGGGPQARGRGRGLRRLINNPQGDLINAISDDADLCFDGFRYWVNVFF